MYLSIDNVVPIDPDKAGKTLADYLHSFGQITFFSLIGLAIISLIVAIVVAKKAGYSGWWGAIAVLFPPAGLVLALLQWPALKERDEALGVLTAHDMMLPSHERKAIKEAERKRGIEDEARKRMEKAQAEREKADAERERFAAAESKRAADASVVAAAAAAAVATPAVATPAVPATTTTAVSTPAAAGPAVSTPAAAGPAAAPGKGDAAIRAAIAAPDESGQPRSAAPESVAPRVPTNRPRTSTNRTTGTAPEGPTAAPEG